MPHDPISLSIYILILLLSLCVGSFLNVLIHRLPLILKAEWKDACTELFGLLIEQTSDKEQVQKLSISFPASHCPRCQHKLKPWHNIPLLSYIFLKGQCAFCKTKIHWQYPLVEFLALAVSFIALFNFGITPQLGLALLFCWTLIVLSTIDLKTTLLPDGLTLSLLWLGLIANYFGLFISLHTAVFGAIIGYGSLWLFFHAFKLATGKEGMGYGDFKLLAALGAWFGWQSLILILVFACIIGIFSSLLFYRNQSNTKAKMIPFGPYLSLAGVLYLFYGPQLLHWYLSFLH